MIISIWFVTIDHVGYGGDSRVYKTLGHELTKVLMNEMALEDNSVEVNSNEEEFGNYSAITASIYQLISGDITGLRNNTVPIIIYHVIIYYLFWNSDFFYLLILNILYSLILVQIIKEYKIKSYLFLLLIVFNPFSLYYGSTHMKEGLIEPLILGAYFELSREKLRYFYLLLWLSLLAFFRLEFAGILLLAFCASKYLQKVKPLLILLSFVVGIICFGTSDTLSKWLISFLLPLPGIYKLSYSWPSGIFLNSQGILHLILLLYCFLFNFKFSNTNFNFMFIIVAILSLNGFGMVGMKDRFISSFITLFLIVIFKSSRTKQIS